MWPFKKNSPDKAVRELVDSLSKALGDRLLSVLIYGSKASGEYREGRSDVNVFVVIDDVSWETLERMGPSIHQWVRADQSLPVLVQNSELQTYADSLPIEFLDMQDHHQVVFGRNPLQGLIVGKSSLRAQCAQELAVKQLKLRQALLLSKRDPRRLTDLLLSTLPSVLTLYRAILRLEAHVPKGPKILAAKQLAERVGFDGDCLDRLWEIHLRRQTDKVDDLAEHYLEGIERALAYVSRKK
jgi:hypothetical protein